MNEIGVSQVLAQIRSLQAQATNAPRPPLKNEAVAASPQNGFAKLLQNAIGQVANTQNNAAKLQESFSMGDRNTDLSSVMLASAKAQVEFKAMTEVRNRLVAAYQDIMNMPL